MGLFDNVPDQSSSGTVFEPNYPDQGGDSPADGGTLPGASGGSATDGWLDTLSKLGGKAIDAYGKYTALQSQKESVDANKATSAAANERARIQAQTQRDLLGFQGSAERSRAARDALSAQQGYQLTALIGSPIVLVAIVAGLFFYSRQR